MPVNKYGVISSLPLPRIANIRDRHYENGHDPYWIIGEVKVPDFVTTPAERALFSNEEFRSPKKTMQKIWSNLRSAIQLLHSDIFHRATPFQT